MRRLFFSIFIALVFFFTFTAFAQAQGQESITITTYYPAPFGVYQRLVTRTLGVGDNYNDGLISELDAPDPATAPGELWVAGNASIVRDVIVGRTTDTVDGHNRVLSVNSHDGAVRLVSWTDGNSIQLSNGQGDVVAGIVKCEGSATSVCDSGRNDLHIQILSDPSPAPVHRIFFEGLLGDVPHPDTIFRGNVGIGMASPEFSLHIRHDAPFEMRLDAGSVEQSIRMGYTNELGGFGYIQAGDWGPANERRLTLQGGGGPVIIGPMGAGTPPSPFTVVRLDSGPQISAWRSSGAGTNKIVGYNMRMDATDVWQLISDNDSGNDFYIQSGFNNTTNKYLTINYQTGAATFTGNISAANFPSPSDLRFKKDIQELSGTLEKLKNIRGVEYQWRAKEFPQKNFSPGKQIGMIAQDVEKEFPELIQTDGDGYKTLSYERFSAVLLEAVKEQQKEFKEQQKEIESLKKEIEVLKNKIGK